MLAKLHTLIGVLSLNKNDVSLLSTPSRSSNCRWSLDFLAVGVALWLRGRFAPFSNGEGGGEAIVSPTDL